jgi:hypothetical protein
MTVLAAGSATIASVWGDLLSVVLYGVTAGVGVAIMFSFAIRGVVLAAAARRASQRWRTLWWGAVGVAGIAVSVAAIGVGLATMLHR